MSDLTRDDVERARQNVERAKTRLRLAKLVLKDVLARQPGQHDGREGATLDPSPATPKLPSRQP